MAVNFAPAVQFHPVDLSRSESERMACWYGDDDLKRLEGDIRREIALFRLVRSHHSRAPKGSDFHGETLDTTVTKSSKLVEVSKKVVVQTTSVVDPQSLEDVSWTRRGLEHMASLRDIQRRQARKMALTKCILVEQERQRKRRNGTVDESTLAKASAVCSRESQTRAIQRAQADEAYVEGTVKNHPLGRQASFVWNRILSTKRGLQTAKADSPGGEGRRVKGGVSSVMQRVRRRLKNSRATN